MPVPDFTGNPELTARCRAAFPALYGALYPHLVVAARAKGYALLLHGSLARDLVAIPWTEDAVDAAALVETIRAEFEEAWIIGAAPYLKPHGRLAWTLMIGGHTSIDLSIMPRIAPEV